MYGLHGLSSDKSDDDSGGRSELDVVGAVHHRTSPIRTSLITTLCTSLITTLCTSLITTSSLSPSIIIVPIHASAIGAHPKHILQLLPREQHRSEYLGIAQNIRVQKDVEHADGTGDQQASRDDDENDEL
jgi:hypothetical protein